MIESQATLGNFATRLKDLIADEGWSLAEAAEATGIAKATLGSWARGSSEPTLDGLVRLSRAVGASIHWLAVAEGPRNADVLASIVNANGHCTAASLLLAAGDQAVKEAAFWTMMEPVIRVANKPGADEKARAAAQRTTQETARQMGIDFDAGPPNEAMRNFVEGIFPGIRDELQRSAAASLRSIVDELRVVEPPVQREGHVEQVIRTYERRPPPMGSGHADKPKPKKKKRGA